MNRFRAQETRTGWKVERLLKGCAACGTKETWQTVLYTYPLLTSEEAEAFAQQAAANFNHLDMGGK